MRRKISSMEKLRNWFSCLLACSSNQGNWGFLRRSMCAVILFAAAIGFFMFIWDFDFLQPERILSQYHFRWQTLPTLKHPTLEISAVSSKILEKSTTVPLLKENITLLKNKIEMEHVATDTERQKYVRTIFKKSFALKTSIKNKTLIYADKKDLTVGTFSSSRTTVNAPMVKHVTIATRHPPSHFITLDFQGRLGNLLFQTASLYGIAEKNNLIPVVSGSLELYRYFYLTVSKNRRSHHFTKTYKEKKGCAFEPGAMSLSESANYKLLGYYQSWKYFKNVEEKVRREFRFNARIEKIASDQFAALVSPASVSSKGSITYVAVHIRRGDMVKNKIFMDYGYVAADVDYVTRGMQFFKSKFKNVIFIMASDDLPWCKKHFTSKDVKYVRSGNSAAIDMAILTKCNHALLTVGSYGWWVGWLINGVTVYYKDYPKKGSKLYSLYVTEDHIPPNWIGM